MAQSRAPSTCQTFVFGKPLVKNTFFESFTKKMLRLWISKIRIWIWSEDSTQSVDFKDSWFVFGIGNPDLDFPKKTHPFTTVAIVLESENNRHTCKLHLWRGAFFLRGGGGESKSGFPNPKTDHESLKSTLWVGSSDQIQTKTESVN